MNAFIKSLWADAVGGLLVGCAVLGAMALQAADDSAGASENPAFAGSMRAENSPTDRAIIVADDGAQRTRPEEGGRSMMLRN